MKVVLASMIVFAWIGWIGAGATFAAEQTWTGQISDALCGVSHQAMAQQVNYTDRECAVACTDSGGKYVFVSEGKVLQITNQDFAGLHEHAAHTVKLTGEQKGDGIVVSKIEMAAKSE